MLSLAALIAAANRLVRNWYPHSQATRRSLSLFALWVGLLFPLFLAPVRTRSELLFDAITPVELIRGLAPIGCLCIGLLLAWPGVGRVSRTEVVLGLFLGIAAASTIWSIAPWATMLKAGSLAVAYVTVLTIARQDEHARRRSLMVLAIVVEMVVFCALVGLLVAPQRAMAPLSRFDPTPRLQGIFPPIAADLLAYFGVLGVLFMLGDIGPRWQRTMAIRLPVIFGCLVALVLTRARVGLLLLVLGLLLGWHRQLRGAGLALLRHRWVKWVAILTVVAGTVAVVVEAHSLAAFVTREQAMSDLLTLTGRTQTWREALIQWANRPFLGYGYYAGHRFAIPVTPGSEDISNLDNMWIESLTDIGVVGGAALLVVIISAAIDLVRPLQYDPQVSMRGTIFVLGLIAGLVNPSLQSYNFAMVALAMVIFGAPRLGLRASRSMHASSRTSQTNSQSARPA